jgi:DNA-binding response OmpR family regulator
MDRASEKAQNCRGRYYEGADSEPMLHDRPISVLLIEDNLDIAENICYFLESRKQSVDYAPDGEIGLRLACSNTYDVLIVDVMLPVMGGLELCRRFRSTAQGDTPILLLTARDELQDKLEGFGVGADDYLTKPFDLDELHARLLALARRAAGRTKNVLDVGELHMDVRSMRVTRAGTPVELSPTGFKILHQLMISHPEIVFRDDLERSIWGDDRPDSDALRSHLFALRKAVDRPFPHKMIETVHGIGLRLRCTDGD